MKPTLFLSNIIEKTYAERVKTGYKRNDIIDACIDVMNKSEEIEEFKNDKEAILVANAAMLFFAGFDTQGFYYKIIPIYNGLLYNRNNNLHDIPLSDEVPRLPRKSG